MTAIDFKYTSIADFGILYTSVDRVTSFWWHINLSNTNDENYVILEACDEDERVNMVALPDSLVHTFICTFSLFHI